MTKKKHFENCGRTEGRKDGRTTDATPWHKAHRVLRTGWAKNAHFWRFEWTTVRAEIFAVVLFSRISRVKPSRKFPLQFMSIYSNDNISKIAKLTTRELPHLAKTAKIMAYTVFTVKGEFHLNFNCDIIIISDTIPYVHLDIIWYWFGFVVTPTSEVVHVFFFFGGGGEFIQKRSKFEVIIRCYMRRVSPTPNK